MKHLLLIISLFFAFSLSAQKHVNSSSENKKAAAVYLGGLLGPVLSINYEHTLNQSFLKGKCILYGRLGGGYMDFWGEQYVFMASQIGIITAADKKHHLDFGIGPLITRPSDGLLPITITAAYRFQEPGGTGYFRIGGGIIEGFQLGVGLRF